MHSHHASFSFIEPDVPHRILKNIPQTHFATQTPPKPESETENHLSRHEGDDEVMTAIYRQRSTPPAFHQSTRSTGPNATSDTTQTQSESRQRRRPRLATLGHAVTTDSSTLPSAMPSAIARDPRRKTAWLKARAQTARDRAPQKYGGCEVAGNSYQMEKQGCCIALGPKRQQITFVKEEELKCILDDRAGTPHISELQIDGDSLGSFSIEELGIHGEAEEMAGVECVGHIADNRSG